MSTFPLLSQSRTGNPSMPDRASVRAGLPDGWFHLLALPQACVREVGNVGALGPLLQFLLTWGPLP